MCDIASHNPEGHFERKFNIYSWSDRSSVLGSAAGPMRMERMSIMYHALQCTVTTWHEQTAIMNCDNPIRFGEFTTENYCIPAMICVRSSMEG
jgi:hypothetical protein